MKKVIILSLLTATLIVGAITIWGAEDKAATLPNRANSESSSTKIHSDETDTGHTHGKYLDYESDIIARTSGVKLLFFHAPWCPQCRALESDIKSKGVPGGVSIIKVDYDSNQNLRQKYGVTIQTTLVKVDDQGNLIEKYVSYEDPSLESVKRNLL